VVMKALAKDPARRYTDADAMMRDLEAALAHLGQERVDADSTAVFAPLPLPVPGPPPTANGAPAGVVAPPLPPDRPPERRGESDDRRRMALVALALTAVAAIVLLAVLLLRGQPTEIVPQVIGQTLDSARIEIGAKHLGVDVKRRSDPAPADTVIDQVPGAGGKVDRDSTVTLIVSNGPTTVRVPDVVGLTLHDARQRLKRVRLTADVSRESSSTVAKGLVIRSDPGPRRLIERGSSVTLSVSTGPEQVSVPSLVGEQEEDAIKLLRDRGLSPVVREQASDQPEGTVVTQTPAANVEVESGSSVTIFVSNGKVAEIPDVTGLREVAAQSRLDRAGFEVTTRTRSTADPAEDGIVLSQSPAAGSKRTQGALVTITVGQLASSTPGGTTP
jgi:beta-lactam-binding protein with PASTA domain